MARRGTKEEKRALRAAPSALESRAPAAGCLALVVAYVAGCGVLLVATDRLVFLGLGVPGLALLAYGLALHVGEECLLGAVRIAWAPRGIRCLMVHSNSPVWEEHIRTSWTPRIGGWAVSLNWSERATWRPSLAVRLFKHFCKRDHNFNPAVVVFRGLRRPLVFRFFCAFHEAARGWVEYLEKLEAEMLQELGVVGAA